MSAPELPQVTAFDGHRRLASGPLPQVARAAKAALAAGAPVLIFDDASGRVVDLDLREPPVETASQSDVETPSRGRGRPKLGVVAREVTLLPRHWDWLNAQPGGASAALRRLVDEARRANAPKDRERAARDAAYRFMSAVAGDLPGYEEALRALFAGERDRFEALTAGWPADVGAYSRRLAFES